LLFWTDDRNQPRKINIDTALADPTYYFNEDHISVAKYYPYATPEISDSYIVEDCAYVPFDSGINTPVGTDVYDAIYDFFVVDQAALSPTIVTALTNNIGMKGWVIGANGLRWEFKLAWFQADNPVRLPGAYGGKYMIFIDRDLSDATALGTPITIPVGPNKFTLNFVEETQKDVSSPWLEEDQTKFTVKNLSFGGFGQVIGYASSATIEDYASSVYAFGTRSKVTDLGETAPPPGPGVGPTFQIPNSFPLNSIAATQANYPRIKHPKIPEDRYFLAWFSNVSGGFFQIIVAELPGFENVGTLTPVNLATEFGLAVGDMISYHWPNKYYNYNFPGDPAFLEDKFVRFSYRFKYDDGEYSIIAPFTQPTFIPKQSGYFLNDVNKTDQNPTDYNNLVPQEQIAGQNTVVDFFVNKVTQVNLKIPLEFPASSLSNNLKVSEIDILYKEANSLSLKVIETIEAAEWATVTDNYITYNYQSRKPIKTLPEDEITRVYDNVPVRAKTQSSSGNRIIYANFYDRHSSPNTLDYYVGVSPKWTSSFPETTNSHIKYPNHTLKQNRSYQVGFILADRYGRSSDVILSSIKDSTYRLDTGIYAFNPITFKGSTIYNPYFSTVFEPKTPNADILTTAHTQAGILDWPGDSLKIYFPEPEVIPLKSQGPEGYPGWFEEPVFAAAFTITVIAGDTITCTTPAVLAKPGQLIKWNKGTALIKSVKVLGATTEYLLENVTGPLGATSVSVYNINPLGFYSYKVVVKQNEQDYYNVYLPSLLQGNPVVKPFELTLLAVAAGTKVIEVNSTVHGDPATFPILEGMVVNLGGTDYSVTNILNSTQFEVDSAPGVVGAGLATFSQRNTSTLNVTTLLTDNANKIPPALNETTPTQAQFATSTTRLIPRVAIDNLKFTATADTNNWPIFPGKQSLKVRSLGNFEAMFVDGKYAGLWQADTDPPTAVIENTFQLGKDSEIAKPTSKEELFFSCYETTPVVSQLEIFYESSSSNTITNLAAS